MIKPIVKDTILLAKKSEIANKDDLYIVTDLLDTLKHYQDRCIGMAANMIGINKRIIVISLGIINLPMINPKIVSKKRPYKTVEGCLSLIGERECTRYEEIEVEYYDINFKKQKNTYKDLIAEIIQHEIDHIEGIII